ncbi:MAG: epoxyqueuosine reductase QueH [Candidatus Omnitrophota bacterium]|nr:epoxyqueuosine reductase QueH [Candidatus Omnitrophota bacterium]
MKVLLHTCCAPCLLAPLEELRSKDFSVTGFFYNPNVHPFSEYKLRQEAVKDLAAKKNLEMIFPEYELEDYFRAVVGHEKPAQRCPICWRMRLLKTAEAAKAKGFDYFTTTLLVSPYQDQDALKAIGEEVSKECGIGFYYQDFRPLFKKAHEEAKKQGIYCQKYCGCVYSTMPRVKERK